MGLTAYSRKLFGYVHREMAYASDSFVSSGRGDRAAGVNFDAVMATALVTLVRWSRLRPNLSVISQFLDP